MPSTSTPAVPDERVDERRLLTRTAELGRIGGTADGGVTRLACSNEDRKAAALVPRWLAAARFDGKTAGARPATCSVWVADTSAERPAHYALLDHVERQRRERLRWKPDQSRFTVGVALLRSAVGAVLNLDPAGVPLDRTCHRCGAPHGRPRLPGTALHLSVAHAGAKVLVAISHGAAVGVDVEEVVGLDLTAVAPAILAPSEPLHRAQDFFAYWCRKEAVVKATGQGLSVPLRTVVVSPVAPGSLGRMLRYEDGMLSAVLHDLSVGDGYAAALAVLSPAGCDLQLLDGDALLLDGCCTRLIPTDGLSCSPAC